MRIRLFIISSVEIFFLASVAPFFWCGCILFEEIAISSIQLLLIIFGISLFIIFFLGTLWIHSGGKWMKMKLELLTLKLLKELEILSDTEGKYIYHLASMYIRALRFWNSRNGTCMHSGYGEERKRRHSKGRLYQHLPNKTTLVFVSKTLCMIVLHMLAWMWGRFCV